MVFSDGRDRVSWLGAEDVEAAARESEASIYVVDSAGRSDTLHMSDATEAGTPDPGAAGRGKPTSKLAVPGGRGSSRYRTPSLRVHESSVFLRRISEQSGGRVWDASAPERLAESFLEVLAHVKSRYLLRYEPTGVAPDGWHKLEVTLRGKKGDVRARRGYFVARGRD